MAVRHGSVAWEQMEYNPFCFQYSHQVPLMQPNRLNSQLSRLMSAPWNGPGEETDSICLIGTTVYLLIWNGNRILRAWQCFPFPPSYNLVNWGRISWNFFLTVSLFLGLKAYFYFWFLNIFASAYFLKVITLAPYSPLPLIFPSSRKIYYRYASDIMTAFLLHIQRGLHSSNLTCW